MRATRMPAPAPRWIQPGAITVVIAVHVLLVLVLLGPAPGPQPLSSDRMRLRWLPRAVPPVPVAPVAVGTRAAAVPRWITAQPDPVPPARVTRADAALVAAPPPLDLRLPDAGADGGTGNANGWDGRRFAPQIIGQREVHPAFAPRRRYVRLHPGMTPEQIVRGIGQFLQLWPAGYTDDPCTLTRQQIDALHDAVEERDRALLREALLDRGRRC